MYHMVNKTIAREKKELLPWLCGLLAVWTAKLHSSNIPGLQVYSLLSGDISNFQYLWRILQLTKDLLGVIFTIFTTHLTPTTTASINGKWEQKSHLSKVMSLTLSDRLGWPALSPAFSPQPRATHQFCHGHLSEWVCSSDETKFWHNESFQKLYEGAHTSAKKLFGMVTWCTERHFPLLGTQALAVNHTDLTSKDSYSLCGLRQAT